MMYAMMGRRLCIDTRVVFHPFFFPRGANQDHKNEKEKEFF
jgi:hypothetical protein